jgi:hypothetical protein
MIETRGSLVLDQERMSNVLKRTLSLIMNASFSVGIVIIIAAYPILGKNTIGKPGMWLAVLTCFLVDIVVIGFSLITKSGLLANLYQGISLLVYLIRIGIAILVLSGGLQILSILLGMLGILNSGGYLLIFMKPQFS